ncbi:HAD family hydrolase [Stappia indica]|uniref:HAD family hydrolase n=1 Tax=Stappia indica TaxID=538381 RepID=UPI000AE9A8C7|nr:HAD family hydrolase [Stappia indica]
METPDTSSLRLADMLAGPQDGPLAGRDIALVIFDCDGVLVDSEPISERVLLAALEEAGVAVDHAYFKAHFLGRSFPRVAQSIRDDFRIALPATFESDYRERLLLAFEAELKPVAGVFDVLDRLAVRACVATSSSPPRVRRSLQLAGLDSYFGEAVFTASQVARGKPAPDLFLHAAAECGIAPERCLVIEDSLPGLEAARAAQMAVWHFIGGSHLDAEDAAPGEPPLPVFDRWDTFFEMAPQLARDTGGRAAGQGS